MGFFSAEDQIIAALDEAFQGEMTIKTAADISRIEEDRLPVPLVYSVYSGFEPTKSIASGSVQEIEHQFYIVVAVSHRSADDALSRKKAEVMVDTCIQALAGRRLSNEFQPLFLKSAPQPEYTSGVALFPLAFGCRAHYRGLNIGVR